MSESRRHGDVLEENNQAWEATLEGRWDDALALYDRILTRSRDLLELRNRGMTRLLIGNLDGAFADFLEARHLPSRAKVVDVLIGVVWWLRGEQERACDDWANEIERKRLGEITHTDEAGGIEAPALLWWASAHPTLGQWRDFAEHELKRLWNTKQCRHSLWPGSLAPFLLDVLPIEALLTAASSTSHPRIQARQHCQAHFYVGAKHLSAGVRSLYRKELSWALAVPAPYLYPKAEYHLAGAELAVER